MTTPVRGAPSSSVIEPGRSDGGSGAPRSSKNDRFSSGRRPIRSGPLNPRMRCALAFAETIRPSSPSTMSPSESDSTTAWKRCSARSRSRSALSPTSDCAPVVAATSASSMRS